MRDTEVSWIMPVSNVGLGAGPVSLSELPGREARPAEHRAAQQAAVPLPQNGDKDGFEAKEPGRAIAAAAIADQTVDRRMQFVVDHQSSEIIVKIIDNATEEVVKVLPPEELQRLHRNLQEPGGFLLDELA
jgi:flagellar protein FlaG